MSFLANYKMISKSYNKNIDLNYFKKRGIIEVYCISMEKEETVLNLSIKNVGKIKLAEIAFDGITVICGNNNTGKSTVGKILFSIFNTLCNADKKIEQVQKREIKQIITKYGLPLEENFSLRNSFVSDFFSYFKDLGNTGILYHDVLRFLKKYPDLPHKNDLAAEIVDKMRIPKEQLLNEYIFRYFNSIFNEQIRNLIVSNRASSKVELKLKGKENSIQFYQKRCVLSQKIPIIHPAYYIDNPFVLNHLNAAGYPIQFVPGNDLDKNVIRAILDSKRTQSDDKMSDIFDSVGNKEKLEEVYSVLRKAYSGTTAIKDNQYVYHEGTADIYLQNISTGLKSFALIERLLESGKLKQQDVLILDEPEIHLHPEWQLIYAEMIVVLQKTFDLTILVTTHSPYFLEALEVYTKKHKLEEKANYYLAINEAENCVMKNVTNNLEEIYQLMFNPMQKLEDMENEQFE